MVDLEEGRWQHKGFCSLDYKESVNDSTKFKQDVSFVNRSLTVEVKSSRDPKILFRELTRGTNLLDEEPTGEIIGGVMLLLFGIALLAQATYLFYRKHEEKPWMLRLTGKPSKRSRDHKYRDREMQKRS